MIRNIKNNLKFALKILRLKRDLNPDPVFLRSAREKFLTSLAPQRASLRHHVIRWSYAFTAVVILFGGTGGLAAFADYKDVPVTSSLYDLKRASETTRLVLTPATKKSEAHAQLAERRLKEIKQAQPTIVVPAEDKRMSATVNTPRPIIKKLDEDLRHEVNKAIERKVEQKERVCKLAAEAVKKNLIERRRGGAMEKDCELDFSD
ncbi:MAG: hypothetical protein A3I39_01270 [Candidatus Yanofskybacteria bacterium RIFCSPLOWO2_02_FULL_47_9b]|uniref:DUF5667 domain-containing protein n=1 Tax=Candidatus Yanofskybacteria bacterium RIFCSPLOWO2_02_FULL_47_9b TaxID=1802708 RepID=A0A1F8HBB0_9BACT|nr:MAG: hypothetical protein A3I39_01270 [Candidatus Yanofskybacteria bacterium RIFCSPLOWO2_02_FULL_47_9b]